ncbi:MAG: GAF domain-containing protein [Anaerolineae bacterium]|nr:GAF domain-containing protein [Anaerolineae bacterium]
MVIERTAASPSEADANALLADLHLLRAQQDSGAADPALLARALAQMEAFISGTSLSRRAQVERARIEVLYRISQEMGSSLDLPQVLEHVIDAVIELTQADRAFLILRNDDGSAEVRTARNFDQQTLHAEDFRYSRSVVDIVLDTGAATFTTNAALDPRFRDSSSVVTQMLRFIIAVPLRLRGSVMGVIYADSRNPGVFAGDDMLPLFETFAAQAAVAIDHARLFSQTDAALSARIEELQQLRRIDLQLNTSLEEGRTLQVTLDWLTRVCAAEAGYAAIVHEGEAVIRHRTGAAASLPVGAVLANAWPQVHDVLGTSRTICFSSGNLSVTLLPILHEGETLAVISMHRPNDGRGPFSGEEIDLAERILARAAVAIDNARLHAAVIAADQAKSEFVGVVAHDLRAPMGTILAYADLILLTGRLDAERVDHIERIRETVYRVDKLIADLADISRIESGQFLIDETRVSVARLLSELRDIMQTTIAAHHHLWAEEVEPGLPDLRADHFRLLQVLTNLVSNAAKYTPDGGTITVSALLTCEHAPGQVCFSVSDTGIGMTDEALAQLGVKFWRSEDSFTRSKPGSGLGFFIAKRLVEQMGGVIRAESTPGMGSRFTFSVPVWQE